MTESCPRSTFAYATLICKFVIITIIIIITLLLVLLKMLQCRCCIYTDCRTDCIFSPDDKLVITGTSVKKGDGVGKLVFLDRQTLKIAAEMDVAPESVSPAFLLVFIVCVCIR